VKSWDELMKVISAERSACQGKLERDRETGLVMNILAIDVGGTHVKILAKGEKEKREIESGPTMTPRHMVLSVEQLAGDWKYDVVSIGYPGPVVDHRPSAEPHNLGSGWMGFDSPRRFKRRGEGHQRRRNAGARRLSGRRMLFLGLGPGSVRP